MEGQDDGNGWVFGLSFICLGIVCVMGMGVFSMVYHSRLRGRFKFKDKLYLSGTYLKDLLSVESVCKDPQPSPDNGVIIFEKNENGTILAGALAEYLCNGGYQLLGPDKKVCMKVGDWEPKDKVFCVITG